jgi:hypothetical protein
MSKSMWKTNISKINRNNYVIRNYKNTKVTKFRTLIKIVIGRDKFLLEIMNRLFYLMSQLMKRSGSYQLY